ncbi:MAG TPA: LysE family transporter [Cytophagaceae bacterium]
MALLWHLIIGALVSFLGSVPPGLINLQVISLSISKGGRQAVLFSLGAALMEILYVSIAIFVSGKLVALPDFVFYCKLVSLPALAILSYHYITKSKVVTVTSGTRRSTNGALRLGIGMGAMNTLQIPFWTTYCSLLLASDWIQNENLNLPIFILGAGLGGLLLHLLLIILTLKYHTNIFIKPDEIKRYLGYVFATLFLFQLLSFFFTF